MRACQACGHVFRGDRCPECGHARPGPTVDDQPLLLPSGPRGALLAAVLALLVFAGVWAAFTWLAPGPVNDIASASTATPTPIAPTPTAPTEPPSPSPTAADPAASDEAWKDVADVVGPGVLGVVASRCRGRPGVGAGLLVAPDRVLTTADVVQRAATITVDTGRDQHVARVLGRDERRNLALLALDGVATGDPVALVPVRPQPGTRLGVATPTRRGDATIQPATVTAIGLTLPTDAGTLGDLLTVRIAQGDVQPGSPVFTAEAGLVGLALVGHVTGPAVDTGHVLATDVLAGAVDEWTTNAPAALRRCPRPDPEPTRPAAPTRDPRPTPDRRGDAPAVADAPDVGPDVDSEWIAVLETLPRSRVTGRQVRLRRTEWDAALSLPRQGVSTRVLRSDDWATLTPGSWLLYLGRWTSLRDARAACAAVLPVASNCRIAELG